MNIFRPTGFSTDLIVAPHGKVHSPVVKFQLDVADCVSQVKSHHTSLENNSKIISIPNCLGKLGHIKEVSEGGRWSKPWGIWAGRWECFDVNLTVNMFTGPVTKGK